MRGDDTQELPEDLKWAANRWFGEGVPCGCNVDEGQKCENCFMYGLLNRAAIEIERLRGAEDFPVVGGEKHCCGLQGFNPMLGDVCPACKNI